MMGWNAACKTCGRDEATTLRRPANIPINRLEILRMETPLYMKKSFALFVGILDITTLAELSPFCMHPISLQMISELLVKLLALWNLFGPILPIEEFSLWLILI
jgi:hypothetical protein